VSVLRIIVAYTVASVIAAVLELMRTDYELEVRVEL
jgi:hypothetical protein